jgi:hypothetical protein
VKRKIELDEMRLSESDHPPPQPPTTTTTSVLRATMSTTPRTCTTTTTAMRAMPCAAPPHDVVGGSILHALHMQTRGGRGKKNGNWEVKVEVALLFWGHDGHAVLFNAPTYLLFFFWHFWALRSKGSSESRNTTHAQNKR